MREGTSPSTSLVFQPRRGGFAKRRHNGQSAFALRASADRRLVLRYGGGWVRLRSASANKFSLDDKRQKITDNDIPDTIQKWKEHVVGHSERSEESRPRRKMDSSVAALPQNDIRKKCFLVLADDIRANGNPSLGDKYDLSISRYKQIDHKEIEYEKPCVILCPSVEPRIIEYGKAASGMSKRIRKEQFEALRLKHGFSKPVLFIGDSNVLRVQ